MSDTIELNVQNSDTIELTVQSSDTIELYQHDSLNISMAMELTVNITEGYNVIPHTLSRPVAFLTSFYDGRLLSLDWTNIDPDTDLESSENIYIPDSLAAYNNVTLYIL